ncbi:MAG TPA: SDR family NAD(P)-dependent oxidoreductase, partial [Nevskiaceae bacterium]|nr:SDR family NAD(P)-dependent oxidoreductase [Nevskiaceae bacterium]
MDLQDRVALVTGAAGSLGKVVAAAYAAAGARLVLVDVAEPFLKSAYPGDDPRRLLLTADLMDAASTAKAIDAAVAKFGRIDAVANIAGGFDMGPAVHETSAELWKKMLDLNAGTVLNV